MKKVIKDGEVAVLYSPKYGAGWWSWNGHKDGVTQQCLFCPEIVEIVEHEDYPNKELVAEVKSLAEKLFGERFYCGGAQDLQVKWILEGTVFRIDEYDGYESVEIIDEVDLVVA